MANGSTLLQEVGYDDKRNGEDIFNKQILNTKSEMKSMLEKFKHIYKQRLHEADKTSGSLEEKLQLSDAILKSYVNDLTEQNELLVGILKDLEVETSQKVKLLENGLIRTSSSMQKYAIRTEKFEEEMVTLTNAKMELQLKCRQLEEEAGRLRLQNASLTRDLNCLVHILKIARSTDHWEIKSLHLQNMRMEDLFSEESDISLNTVSKENAKNLETNLEVGDAVIRPRHKVNNDAVLLGDHLSVRHHGRSHDRRRESNPQLYNEVAYSKVQSDLKQALLDKDVLTNEILKKDGLLQSLQKQVVQQEEEIQALQCKLFPSQILEDVEVTTNGSTLKNYQLALMTDAKQKAETMLKLCLETSPDDQRTVICQHEKKIKVLEKQLKNVHQEKDELLTEVNDMSVHLNKLHTSFEETRNVLTAEIAEKHDLIKKLREEQLLLENKYKEAVMTITHRGEVIKELRKDLKDSSNCIVKLEEVTNCHCDEKVQLIEDLQNQLIDYRKKQDVCEQEQQQFRKKDEDINKLKVQIETLNKENRSFANALIRRDTVIQNLESDLNGIRQQYQNALEEIGRLNARLQTFTINAENEQSRVTQELKRHEETIHSFRLDQMRLQDLNTQANAKISQQERTIENLQGQHKTALQEISDKYEVQQRQQQQLNDVQRQNHSYSNEMFQLQDKIELMKQELQQAHNHQANLQDQLLNREEELNHLQQNIDQLQQQKHEASSKASEQETIIEKLEAEIAALRLSLFKKSSEVDTQQDALQKLEYSFMQSLNDVENGRRKADKEISSQTELIKQLREDLIESQRQYSVCYDEVIQQENIVEKIKQENVKLAEEVTTKQQLIKEFTEKLAQLELELTVTKERYKTCQKEVDQKNQEIIKGQSDFDTLRHKLQIVNNEVVTNRNEYQRLQHRLTDQQMEIKQYKLQQEIYRQQIEDGKNINTEIEAQKNQLDVKILDYNKIIDELKTDLKTIQHKYEAEKNVHKEDCKIQERQLEEMNQKLSQYETTIFNQKENLFVLRKEAEDYNHKYQQVQKEYQEVSNLLLHKDQGLREEKEKVLKLEQAVQQAKTELEQLENMIIGQKSVQEELSNTNSALSIIEKKVQDYREEVVKKNTKIVSLEEDLTNTHNQLEESHNRINSVNTIMGQQTQDLNQTREDLENNQKSLLHLEGEFQQLQENLNNKNTEMEEQTKLFLKIEKEYQDYRKNYRQDIDEFDELEHKIRELDTIVRSVQYLLEERTQENMQLQQQLIQEQQEATDLKTKTERVQTQATKMQEITDELKEKFQQEEAKYNQEKSEMEKKMKLLEENLNTSFIKNKNLEQHVAKQEKWLHKSDGELKAFKNKMAAKVDEIEQLENTVKNLKSKLVDMKRWKYEWNNENELLKKQLQQLSAEIQSTKEEQKKYIQKGAYQDEKIILMEKTVNSFKEQLSDQRSLNLQQKHNQEQGAQELQRKIEDNKNLQQNINEHKELIVEMKKDLITMAGELQHGMQVYQKHRDIICALQEELKTSREHERKLKVELEKKSHSVQELEEILCIEKDLRLKLQKDLENIYMKLAEMNEVNNSLQEQGKSKDVSLHETTLQLKTIQEKFNQMTENLSKKEEQLRHAEKHLEAVEQSTSSQNQQVTFFSDTIANLQKELLEKEEKNKQNETQCKEKDHLIQELKLQLAPSQSHNQEMLIKLADQGKQTVSLRLELTQAGQQNEVLMQELSMMETTLANLKLQLHQTQEFSDKKELELCLLTRKYDDVCNRINQYENELKHNLLEISRQEEDLLNLRVELNQLNNRYQQKLSEQNKLQQQLLVEQRKMLSMEKELTVSREALKDADRLRQESHQVATNLNSWISDQKNNTTTMETKIREQQREITELLAQKQKLLENNHTVRKVSHRLKEKLEQKLEFQKNLSSPQSSMIRSSYNNFQNISCIEPLGKNNMVEDLLHRLRSNVDSIIQLNHQLSSSHREKAYLEAELEKEVISRRTVESKLEMKDQTIAHLQLMLQTSQPITLPLPSSSSSLSSCYGNLDSHSSIKIPMTCSQVTNTHQDSIHYNSSDAHGYWMKRAKQLSTELEQSSGYWSQKVDELTTRLSPIRNITNSKPNI